MCNVDVYSAIMPKELRYSLEIGMADVLWTKSVFFDNGPMMKDAEEHGNYRDIFTKTYVGKQDFEPEKFFHEGQFSYKEEFRECKDF